MFRWLRHNDPVRWYDWPHGRGYWAVTRHDDLVAVHKDTATFSSETGATALEDLEQDAIEARKSMLDTDPPRHTRLRALVNRGFTPAGGGAPTSDLLRELTDHILDRALPMGEFDFVEDVAAVLPIRVLCEILGVPHADTSKLIEWGDAMIGSTDPDLSDISYEHPDERPVPAAAVPQPGGARGLPLRPRACGRAPRAAGRRHRHQARPGRDRRRAA